MATGTFRVTPKTKGYRRNTTRPVSLTTLLGFAVMLVAIVFVMSDPLPVHSADLGGNAFGSDLAGGSARNANNTEHTNPVALQSECIAGDLDTSFNPGAGVTRGVSATGFNQSVNAFAVQPDGKILAGGRLFIMITVAQG